MKAGLGKQQYILDVAESVFIINGFKNTTIRAITAKAKINVAMLHYYFNSKEQLFQHVLKRKIEMLGGQSDRGYHTLKEIITFQIDAVMNNWDFYRLLYSELLTTENGITRECILSFMDSAKERIRIAMGNALADKKILGSDIEIMVASFFGTLIHSVAFLNENDSRLKSRLLHYFMAYFDSIPAKS